MVRPLCDNKSAADMWNILYYWSFWLKHHERQNPASQLKGYHWLLRREWNIYSVKKMQSRARKMRQLILKITVTSTPSKLLKTYYGHQFKKWSINQSVNQSINLSIKKINQSISEESRIGTELETNDGSLCLEYFQSLFISTGVAIH